MTGDDIGRWEDDELLLHLSRVLTLKALERTLAQIKALPVVKR